VVSPPASVRPGATSPIVPRLAAEIGHRGFAVGAGDRRDVTRLAPIETRRDLRIAAPGFSIDEQGQPIQLGAGRGQHGGGAAPHSINDEIAAIGIGTGKGGEQKARLDFPRIRRQSGYFGVRAQPSCHIYPFHSHH
jgi:hypothetical protein